MGKADQAFRAEQWEEAIKYLLQIEKSDSKLLVIRSNMDLAVAYRKVNQLARAKQCAQRVIEMDPQNPEGYKRLSHVTSRWSVLFLLMVSAGSGGRV
jgi:predicted Zn-dependent protease